MMSWAVLAGGALTYLSLNALPSSTQLEALATLPPSTQESNRTEHDREQLTAQVQSLNETVAKLRGDLARLKSEQQTPTAAAPIATDRGLTAMRQAESAPPQASNITTSSVAKSEPSAMPTATAPAAPVQQETNLLPAQPEGAETTSSSTAPIMPKIMNAPAAPAPAATAEPTQVAAAPAAAPETPPRRLRNLATAPLRSGRVPPLPGVNAALAGSSSRALGAGTAPQTNLLNNTTREINTAGLPIASNVAPRTTTAAPAVSPNTFGVSTVTERPLPTAAALSLSTAQSVTGLRASWLLLTSRHPETFNRLQPRYIADQANSTYRLLAGPILSHAEADRICTHLRAQSVSCGVTTYVGSALQ